MALATHFSVRCKKGGKGLGEATIILRAGDEANVSNGSQQQPWCVVCTVVPTSSQLLSQYSLGDYVDD